MGKLSYAVLSLHQAEHVETVAVTFYCRGLAQNTTMLGFLGEHAVTVDEH